MMDLIKSTDSKYEEYENLLLERDQITKEAGQIWTVYLQLFGKLITDNYEEKLECIKCKKTIAYYQNALNHGGVVDSAAMEKYMEQEMAEYYANLRRMLKENEDANNAGTSTPYEVARAKTLYRRLAKLIHPDINPETDHSKELQELWQRILIAYHHNDVKELSELEVLVRKVLKELGSEDVKVDIPDIEEKIEALKSEIEGIKQTEPYCLRYLVEDEEAAEKKKTELREELETYQKYHKELNEVILKMLQTGGLKIYVQ
jgi:hypothetical protein